MTVADDIREELAADIRYTLDTSTFYGITTEEAGELADELLASPVIARIRAEAWDEGFEAAVDNARKLAVLTPNPHRPASIRSESGDDRG